MKLRQGNIFTPVCDSVHRGVSVPGSLSQGGLCPGPGGSLSGGLCPGGLCPGGSLSREVSVQGALCPGSLCPGGFLSRGVSVQGSLCQGDPPCGYMLVVRILRECILVDPATKNCKHNRGEKMGLDVVSSALMPISSVLMWILYHFSLFSKWYSVIVVKSDCPIGEECDDKIPSKFLIWFGVCPSSNYNLEENPFLKSPL